MTHPQEQNSVNKAALREAAVTIFQRITQPFQKLISKLNKDDETEATICDDLDPYMISVVKRLNEHATDNVVPMTRARSTSRVA